jgi:hypothetical protein
MRKPKRPQSANIYLVREHFLMVALSGSANHVGDYRAFSKIAPASISDAELGGLVRSALRSSRLFEGVRDRDIRHFYEVEYPEENRRWLERLLTKFEVKTVPQVFRKALLIDAKLGDGQIALQPNYIVRGVPDHRDVPPEHRIILSETVSDEVLGEAVRLSFSRYK